MDEVPGQCGHAGEGERRDGQELPHAEVEVPAKEVYVDERSEKVVVVPCTAEDIRLVDCADVDEVLNEEWARRGGRCGAERDGGVGRSGRVSNALKPRRAKRVGISNGGGYVVG